MSKCKHALPQDSGAVWLSLIQVSVQKGTTWPLREAWTPADESVLRNLPKYWLVLAFFHVAVVIGEKLTLDGNSVPTHAHSPQSRTSLRLLILFLKLYTLKDSKVDNSCLGFKRQHNLTPHLFFIFINLTLWNYILLFCSITLYSYFPNYLKIIFLSYFYFKKCINMLEITKKRKQAKFEK